MLFKTLGRPWHPGLMQGLQTSAIPTECFIQGLFRRIWRIYRLFRRLGSSFPEGASDHQYQRQHIPEKLLKPIPLKASFLFSNYRYLPTSSRNMPVIHIIAVRIPGITFLEWSLWGSVLKYSIMRKFQYPSLPTARTLVPKRLGHH